MPMIQLQVHQLMAHRQTTTTQLQRQSISIVWIVSTAIKSLHIHLSGRFIFIDQL
jgi:hypothetical protein